MKKQIFSLMLGTAVIATHPAFAMHEGMNDEPRDARLSYTSSTENKVSDENTKKIKINISYTRSRTLDKNNDQGFITPWDIQVRPIIGKATQAINKGEVLLFREDNKIFFQVANKEKLELRKSLVFRIIKEEDLDDINENEVAIFSRDGTYYFKAADKDELEMPFGDQEAAIHKILGLERKVTNDNDLNHVNAYKMHNFLASYSEENLKKIISEMGNAPQVNPLEAYKKAYQEAMDKTSPEEKLEIKFRKMLQNSLEVSLKNLNDGIISNEDEDYYFDYILTVKKYVVLPSAPYLKGKRYDRLQDVLTGKEKILKEDEDAVRKLAFLLKQVDFNPKEQPEFSISVGQNHVEKVSLPLIKKNEFEESGINLTYEIKNLEVNFPFSDKNLDDPLEIKVEGDMALENKGYMDNRYIASYFDNSKLPEIDGRHPNELCLDYMNKSHPSPEKLVKVADKRGPKISDVANDATFEIEIFRIEDDKGQIMGEYRFSNLDEQKNMKDSMNKYFNADFFKQGRMNAVNFSQQQVAQNPSLAFPNALASTMRESKARMNNNTNSNNSNFSMPPFMPSMFNNNNNSNQNK